jgi:hypothetical protein
MKVVASFVSGKLTVTLVPFPASTMKFGCSIPVNKKNL